MDIIDKASNLYNNLLSEAKSIKSNGANESVVDKAIVNTVKLTKVVKTSMCDYDTSAYAVDVFDTIDTLNSVIDALISDDINTETLIISLVYGVGDYIDALQKIKDGVKPDILGAINKASKEYIKLIDVIESNGDKKTALDLVFKLETFAESYNDFFFELSDDFAENDDALDALDDINNKLKDDSSKNELLADINMDIDAVDKYIFDAKNMVTGDNSSIA